MASAQRPRTTRFYRVNEPFGFMSNFARAPVLATGDAVLVEHTANDAYWADAGDGSGRNRLGELLMELRAELREGGGR